MPKDKKQRWVVRTWSVMGDPRNEALLLEGILNDLDDSDYDVRDINWEKTMVVGHLKDGDTNFPDVPEIPQELREKIEGLRDRLDQHVQTVQPEPQVQAQPQSHTIEEIIANPKGARTTAFMMGVRNCIEMSMRGADTRSLELNVERLVKVIFRGISSEEAKNTMVDLTAIHADYHKNTQCDGDCCKSAKRVLAMSIETLGKHVQASPLN